MKFILGFLPTLPVTQEQRLRERPVAYRTEYWQRMFDQIVEIARLAEDVGFDIATFTEHHLHTEGLEVGSVPSLSLYTAMNTKHIKVGPIGYVLPGWNPLRLAVEIGWLDQLTKGRSIVGMARGYQTRWLNSMAQKLHVQAAPSDQSEVDLLNRKAFEEVFQILKLAWKDEAFSFKGEFWEFPYPYEEGTPWKAAQWTETYGAPGEVVDGLVRKISVVPKPYQKPHPPVFQAFSISEATVAWCGREGINAVLLSPRTPDVRRLAELYKKEAAAVGRTTRLGQGIASAHSITIARDKSEAFKLAEAGIGDCYYKQFGGVFGFWEAFRVPEDEEKYPRGKVMLPTSEWTVERLDRCDYMYSGTVSDIRRKMDHLVEQANPEFFNLGGDQGFLPLEVVKEQIRTFGEQILPHYK
ncbi:MAG TPA: LLM class flavin-dependent oxidoreductase [Candidatus Binataceae bacterium]|nr:LLM class flavin-dependent oxidoreductase [Candidatus Binataceae bacterium]